MKKTVGADGHLNFSDGTSRQPQAQSGHDLSALKTIVELMSRKTNGSHL